MNLFTILKPSLLVLVFTSFMKSTLVVAAPITFNTALPLSQGQRLIRGLVSYEEQSGSFDQSTNSQERLSLTSVLAYGVTAKLAAFAVLPVSNIKQSFNNQELSDSALGDVELFSRYEVWKKDGSGVTQRIAPFVGVRLPSGETGISSDGTTDVYAGLIFTSARTKNNFDMQIRFDLNGNHQGLDVGNAVSISTSWQRRIAPSKISASTKGFWFAALESNAQYTEKSRLLGEANPNSGGVKTFIAPGIQYITRKWIAEFAVQIPVFLNLNGEALEPDFTVFTGIRTNF